MPAPRNPDMDATVEVTVTFSDAERDVLDQFRIQSGWGDHEGPVPPEAIYTAQSKPLAGHTITPNVNEFTLEYMTRSSEVLKLQPSLNLVYLPAERRLAPPNSVGVDLTQLSDDVTVAKLQETRNNFARLDDSEFESYASALCIQGALSGNQPSVKTTPSRWDSFKAAVDELLHPKQLLPLTAEHSSALRIGLADGSTHSVNDLSSGERQALIVISRVFRAGEGRSFVVIDEPDAYLHPALSTRLLKALRPGLGEHGRMLVATHSPAIPTQLPHPPSSASVTQSLRSWSRRSPTDWTSIERQASMPALSPSLRCFFSPKAASMLPSSRYSYRRWPPTQFKMREAAARSSAWWRHCLGTIFRSLGWLMPMSGPLRRRRASRRKCMCGRLLT